MNQHFSAGFFAGNRERLRQLFTGTAPIVIGANVTLQRGADLAFPFHQDANFWYLTGLDIAGAVLVMDKGKEYLIVPDRSEILDLFEGKTVSEAITERSGIERVLSYREGWKLLRQRIKRSKHVATLAPMPTFMEHYDMYTNPGRTVLVEALRTVNAEIELLDLRQHLMKMRTVKQPEELAAIRLAVGITVDTLRGVTTPASLAKWQTEYELEAAITAGFRKRGAYGHAFDPIVAAGANACTIHYMTNNDTLKDDQFVLLDVGAGVEHYGADISRTVIRGAASKRQRAVYEAVNGALQFGMDGLKPGAEFATVEKGVRQFVGEKLRELGLIKTIDEESVHKYYPHAPHYLGLDTHDVGDYRQPLEPGMVLTMEPGIYIPDEGIGVRIEEDILITETGYECLSARLPRELA